MSSYRDINVAKFYDYVLFVNYADMQSSKIFEYIKIYSFKIYKYLWDLRKNVCEYFPQSFKYQLLNQDRRPSREGSQTLRNPSGEICTPDYQTLQSITCPLRQFFSHNINLS